MPRDDFREAAAAAALYADEHPRQSNVSREQNGVTAAQSSLSDVTARVTGTNSRDNQIVSQRQQAVTAASTALAYYRRLRLLPWAVLWLPFEMLKRLFLLEALLAYQMRPVKPPLPVHGRFPTWRSMLRPGRPPAAENAGA